MFIIQGKYGIAKILQDENLVEASCKSQIQSIMDSKVVENQNVAVMADCHSGKGSCIGYTQTITNRVIPSTVGVDIGCGMLAVQLHKNLTKPELEKLDKVIHQKVPLGSNRRKDLHRYANEVLLQKTIAPINSDLLKLSIGTLGGGNHFIEVDVDSNDNQWLVIHTGSRHLGVEICNYWQNKAIESHSCAKACKAKVAELKAAKRFQDIETELKKIKDTFNDNVDAKFAYLENQDFWDYLHDMGIAQNFASWNREAIADVILREMFCSSRVKIKDKFCSVHNYIDLNNMILRKGATSLQKGERALIPINMSYGSLIVKGKGNKEFNCSGPHGAGRLMSRTQARENLKMEDYKASMKGIYTTSVATSTIDEAPQAYKPVESILSNIKDLCDVVEVLKPIYNCKDKG